MDIFDYVLESSSADEATNHSASDVVESDDSANIEELHERVVQTSLSPDCRGRKRKAAKWLSSLAYEEPNDNAADGVESEDNANTKEVREREEQTSVPSPRRLRKRKGSKLPSSSANAGERGDNANTEEVQELEVLASLPPRHRRRKVSKWPEDVIVVSELMENGLPTDKKAVRRMRKLAGLIARQRVSILLPSLDDLGEKEWSRVIKDYILPFLRFEEPVRLAGLQRMMRMIYKSFRNYKSILVRDFVRKGLNPIEKHPYILPEVWPEFVRLKETEEAKKISNKFKKIRAMNKHDHCLGTAGYDGAVEKWEKQDRELASRRIPNPWHKYPAGRSRGYLRGHGRLVISKDSAQIEWASKSAESVSEQIVEKQIELESSGLADTLIRDKDVLSLVLGPERTGRMRGVSSYRGWKFWPNCSEMYRKRKCVDKDTLCDDIAKDVIAKLCKLGMVLPSDIRSSVGKYSSCGSVNNVQLDGPDGITNPNLVQPLTVPTYCTLVSNPGGYQVDLARGEVFPQQTELNSVPVLDGYAVVRVDFVSPGFGSFVLNPPPSDDITTLGDALFKKVQWRKCGIVISSKEVPNERSLELNPVGVSAKTNLKHLTGSVSAILFEQANSAPAVGDCASKDHAEGKKQTNSNISSAPSGKTIRKELVRNVISSSQDDIPKCAPTVGSKDPTEVKKQASKSTHGTAGSSAASRPPKSNTKRGQQVGVNQQQQQQVGVKQQEQQEQVSSVKQRKQQLHVGVKRRQQQQQQVDVKQQQQQQQQQQAHLSSEPDYWIHPNPNFKVGERMIADEELFMTGPACLALHNYYMKAVAENKDIGISARVPPEYFMRPCPVLTMGFQALFDFLTAEALDVPALRIITVYLIELCMKHSMPVRFLDPDALSRSTLSSNRAYSVEYLESCLMDYGKENYVMFAFYTGSHWVAVVIVPNWNKVLYLDSNRAIKTELDDITSVIDEAYENFQNKVKKSGTKFKLIHVPKVPCLTQPLNNTSGFYAIHHMMLMMAKKNINAKRSQDLDLTSLSIEDSHLTERIANFIVRFIINPKGKFHDPRAAFVNNKQYMELWNADAIGAI